MSISFSGSTLTFSDSTTMTTAAVAGPPGPAGSPGSAGSTGPTGPTGAAGTNASVVTTYGAVGTYAIAYLPASSTNIVLPNTTYAGACLKRATTTAMSGGCAYGGVFNAWSRSGGFGTSCKTYCVTSLSLTGTWQTMAAHKARNICCANLNILVRIS